MSERFKILPLLVFVAMLAFSVRLAEVVTGLRSLSGAAFAEQAKPEEKEPEKPEEEVAKKPGDSKDKASAEKAGTAPKKETDPSKESKSKTAEDKSKPDEKGVEWKDASDSDIGVEMVKKEMFEDLTKRRETLEKREKELATREALLRAAEQEMDRKFQEMQSMRTEIENLLKTQSEEEKARIMSLVKIYEGMKPKEAARIFDTLDLDVLVNVVSSMSERKLSPILAAMSPERAKGVTILLAEQKKLPELTED
jgi:flagellar motility protein MotE (MotC chaperone)